MKKGFTIIELLTLAAIITVLAAIAVPNFLEAQTRSKVARTLWDMRNVGVALGAYKADHKTNPRWWKDAPNTYNYTGWLMMNNPPVQVGQRFPGSMLTTPTAYLSIIPWDFFNTQLIFFGDRSFFKRKVSFVTVLLYPGNGMYMADGRAYEEWWEESFRKSYDFPDGDHTIELQSAGPDLLWWSDTKPAQLYYDPTNGAGSAGNIWWFDNYGSIP